MKYIQIRTYISFNEKGMYNYFSSAVAFVAKLKPAAVTAHTLLDEIERDI